MSSGIDSEALIHPLGGDDGPCGKDLEDTQEMAAIDAFRVFGQATPLKADTDWRAIRDASAEALETCKDFRLLAHLAAANLRLTGLQSLSDALGVAARWLELYFDQVYPRLDGSDAVLRKNALGYFADRMAIVDALRRIPLVKNPQLGPVSLRHVELAEGNLKPGPDEGEPPTESQVMGAFAGAPQEDLTQLAATLNAALEALKAIETAMVASQGVQAAPSMAPLIQPLSRMREIVGSYIRAPAAEGAAAGADGASGSAAAPAGISGEIRSREDAIRSLDAVSDFFRRAEPSSPVPLFVDRAKRVIARDFLEVLAELAPDSVADVKRVGGIRDAEE
jgi:type VI secretion system protein ImpA